MLIIPQEGYPHTVVMNIEPQSSFSRHTFLSDLADLTDLELDFYFLLLYVLII